MSFWRDRGVFVTGGDGPPRIVATEELVGRGARVTCLVRDWVPRSRFVGTGLLERTTVVRGDLEDAALRLRVVRAGRAAPRRRRRRRGVQLRTETPLSVIDAVTRILAIGGRPDLVPRILAEAPHEIPRQFLDCGKARRRLGWTSRFTFEEGLRETVEWYRGWLSGPPG